MADEKSKTPWGLIVTTIIGGAVGLASGGIGGIILGLLGGFLGGFAVQAGVDTLFAKKEGDGAAAPATPGDEGASKDGTGPDEPGKSTLMATVKKSFEQGTTVDPLKAYNQGNPGSAVIANSSTLPTLGAAGTAAGLMRLVVQPVTNGILNRTGINWVSKKLTGRELGLRYGFMPGAWRTPEKIASDARGMLEDYVARQHNAALPAEQKALTASEASEFRKIIRSEKLRLKMNVDDVARMRELVKVYDQEHPGWLRRLWQEESTGVRIPETEGDVIRVRADGKTEYLVDSDGREPGLRVRIPGTEMADPATYIIEPEADLAKLAREAGIQDAVKAALLEQAKVRIEASAKESAAAGKPVTEAQKTAALETVAKAIDVALEPPKPGATPASLTLESLEGMTKTAVETATGTTPAPKPVAGPPAPAPVDNGAVSRMTPLRGTEQVSVKAPGDAAYTQVEPVPESEGLGKNVYRSRTAEPGKGVRYFTLDETGGVKVADITRTPEALVAESLRGIKGVDPAVLKTAASHVTDHGNWATGKKPGDPVSEVEAKFWKEATPEEVARVVEAQAKAVTEAAGKGTVVPESSVSDIVKAGPPTPAAPPVAPAIVTPAAIALALEGMKLPHQADVLKHLGEIKDPALQTLRDALTPEQLKDVARAYDAELARAKAAGKPVAADALGKEIQRVSEMSKRPAAEPSFRDLRRFNGELNARGSGYVFHGLAVTMGADQLARGLRPGGDWRQAAVGGSLLTAGTVGTTAETVNWLQYRTAYAAELSRAASAGQDIKALETIKSARQGAVAATDMTKAAHASRGLGMGFGLFEMGIGGADIYTAATMDERDIMYQYRGIKYGTGAAHLTSGALITTASITPYLSTAMQASRGISVVSKAAGPVGVIVQGVVIYVGGFDVPFTDVRIPGVLDGLQAQAEARAAVSATETRILRQKGRVDVSSEFFDYMAQNQKKTGVERAYAPPTTYLTTQSTLQLLREWERNKIQKANGKVTDDDLAKLDAKFKRVWEPDELSNALKTYKEEIKEEIKRICTAEDWDAAEYCPEAFTDERISDSKMEVNAKKRADLATSAGEPIIPFWIPAIAAATDKFYEDVLDGRETKNRQVRAAGDLMMLTATLEGIKSSLVEVDGDATIKDSAGKDQTVFHRKLYKTVNSKGERGTDVIYESTLKNDPKKYDGMVEISRRVDNGGYVVVTLGKVVEEDDPKIIAERGRLISYRTLYKGTADYHAELAKALGDPVKKALAEKEKEIGAPQITQSAEAMDTLFKRLLDPKVMKKFSSYDYGENADQFFEQQARVKPMWQQESLTLPWKADAKMLGLGRTGLAEIDDFFSSWSAYKRVQGPNGELDHLKDANTKQFMVNNFRLSALGATQVVLQSGKAAASANELLDAQLKRIEASYDQLDKLFGADKDTAKYTGWDRFKEARDGYKLAMAQIDLMADGEVKTALAAVAKSNMVMAMPQLDQRVFAAVKEAGFQPGKEKAVTLFNLGKDPAARRFDTPLLKADAAPEAALVHFEVFKKLKDVKPEDRLKKLNEIALGTFATDGKGGSGYRAETQQAFGMLDKEWKLSAMQGEEQRNWVRAYAEAKRKASGKPEDDIAKLLDGKKEEDKQKILKDWSAWVEKEADDILKNMEGGVVRTGGKTRLQEAEQDLKYFTVTSYIKRTMPWLNEGNIPVTDQNKADATKLREQVAARRKLLVDRYMAADNDTKVTALVEDIARERTQAYLADNVDESLQLGYLPMNVSRQLGAYFSPEEIEQKLGFKTMVGNTYNEQLGFVGTARNMDQLPEKMPDLLKKYLPGSNAQADITPGPGAPLTGMPKLLKVVPVVAREEAFDTEFKGADRKKIQKDKIRQAEVTYEDAKGEKHVKVVPFSDSGNWGDDHLTHVVLAAIDPKAALKRQLEAQGLSDVTITEEGGKTIVEVTDNRADENAIRDLKVNLDKEYRDKFAVAKLTHGENSEQYKKLQEEYKGLVNAFSKDQLTSHPNDKSRRYRFVGALSAEKLDVKGGVETLTESPVFTFEKLQWKNEENNFVDAVPPTRETKQRRVMYKQDERRLSDAKDALKKAGLPAALVDYDYFLNNSAKFSIGNDYTTTGTRTMSELLRSVVMDDRSRVSFEEVDARVRRENNFKYAVGSASPMPATQSEMSADKKTVMVKARISLEGGKYSDYRGSFTTVELVKDIPLETVKLRRGEYTMDLAKMDDEVQRALFYDRIEKAPVARAIITLADGQKQTVDMKAGKITMLTADRQTRDLDVEKGTLALTIGDGKQRVIDMKTGKMTVTDGGNTQEIDLTKGRYTIERSDGFKQDLEWRDGRLAIIEKDKLSGKDKPKIEIDLDKYKDLMADLKRLKSPDFRITLPDAKQQDKYISAELSGSSTGDKELYDEEAKNLLMTLSNRLPMYVDVRQPATPQSRSVVSNTGTGTNTGTGEPSQPPQPPMGVQPPMGAQPQDFVGNPHAMSTFWMNGGRPTGNFGAVPLPGQTLPGGKMTIMGQGTIGTPVQGAPGAPGMNGPGAPGMGGPGAPGAPNMPGANGIQQILTVSVTDPASPMNGQQITLIGETRNGLLYAQDINGMNFGAGRVIIDLRNPATIEGEINNALQMPFAPQRFTPDPVKQPLPPAFQGPAPAMQPPPNQQPPAPAVPLLADMLGALLPNNLPNMQPSAPKGKNKGQETV